MSIAEKLITIAENEQKIYDKGSLDASPQETVSGEAIVITDISPIEHNMGVSVRGKQMIPPQKSTVTVQGYTYDSTNGDGSFIINTVGDGSTTSSKEVLGKNLHDLLIDGETYTFAMDNVDKKPVAFVLATTRLSDNKAIYHTASSSNNFIQRFTIDKSTYRYDRMYLQINATSEVFENVVVKPILALGTYTSLPFVPYIADISKVKLMKQGKNLFNNDTSLIKQVNYIVNGTENFRNGYEIALPMGTYTINAFSKETFSDVYLYGCVADKNNNRMKIVNFVLGDYTVSVTFTIEDGESFKLYDGINNQSITASQNRFKKFDIQLEVGTTPTEYEPYIEPTIYDVSADGSVEGVKSLYPSTTLYTDTNGAVVDATYYQDGKKVKENLIDMILSLGGVINED